MKSCRLAARQTARNIYDAAKAENERKQQEWKDAKSKPNTAKQTADERAMQEKRQKEIAKQAEARRLDPENIRWTIDRNATTVPDERDELKDDEREVIDAHLGTLYLLGKQTPAEEYRLMLMRMTASKFSGIGYAMIEIAAYTAGFCNAEYDLDTLCNELYEQVAQVC